MLRHVLGVNRPAISGWLATNTITQGSTHRIGLKWAYDNGYRIVVAERDILWPGKAAVTVHMFVVVDTRQIPAGFVAEKINSRGGTGPEIAPQALKSNAGLSFQGSVVLGMGFTLTPEQRDELVTRDKRNAERIFPYLGGEEVNTSPTQAFHRYVINFGDMSIDEARHWPDLLAIVRETVKPERDKVKRDAHRKYWWHYGDKRPALYAAIRDLPRCLVTARVAKHLIFAFQPTDRVFSEQLYVYPLSYQAHFAILQSRIHSPWAWLLSSTMREAGIRYAASDCFDTFPFPQTNPRDPVPELEDIGQRLYDARATFMTDTEQGLTKTYNALQDHEVTDPRIIELRHLHEEMDRAVLNAYGWDDIEAPPFAATHDETAVFRAEVVRRLYALNIARSKADGPRGLFPP